MTTNFDSVQMLETSYVCGKFSKSVSYETLVAGTTTTGRGIKQKESSLILRKAKFQAIFKFVLSSASGGAGGGKYNRISAFVSMPVLLIRSSLEFFRVPRKNRDDSSFCFGFAKVLALAFIFTLATTSGSSAETWDCGEIANTVSCSLDDNGVFNMSGTGKMKDYQYADRQIARLRAESFDYIDYSLKHIDKK